jgi:hypothetical protein
MVGALQRSVLTGLNLLASPPHPAKVFSEVPDAIDWLLPHLGAVCGPRSLAEVTTGVREFCDTFQQRDERAQT